MVGVNIHTHQSSNEYGIGCSAVALNDRDEVLVISATFLEPDSATNYLGEIVTLIGCLEDIPDSTNNLTIHNRRTTLVKSINGQVRTRKHQKYWTKLFSLIESKTLSYRAAFLNKSHMHELAYRKAREVVHSSEYQHGITIIDCYY